MNRQQVEIWIDTFKNAWVSKNIELILDIFSETEEYCESPFTEPFTKIWEIEKCWLEINYQNNMVLDINILAIESENVILHWYFSYQDSRDNTTYTMDGVYQLKFNSKSKCCYFKQWWVLKE